MILELNPIKLQKQCDEFNEKCNVGSKVRLTMDSGEIRETTTKTPAVVMGGHTAVIFLDCVSSCQLLDRVAI